jgi:hypothetical protein
MDLGDWVFLGMVAISGIASISKMGKKKAAQQSSQQQTLGEDTKSDADDWLKNILRETTKGLVDADDFLPKNDPKPSVHRPELEKSQPSNGAYPKNKVDASRRNANAEQYRRSNQSLESTSRPLVSLEDTKVVEGKVSHTGLHGSMPSSIIDSVDQSPLDPADDFKDSDEVRKAIIYGEIMRTKF